MSIRSRILVSTALAAALLTTAVAQDAKKAPEKKAPASKILQPQMSPEKGTFKEPMGKIGETPAQPWSATTVVASVDGKPNPGATIKTVVGEIVDFSCYLQVGKHGEKHRPCGQKCINAGAPIGLLTENGTLYMLMEEEHDPRRDGQGTFRAVAAEHIAHVMEVTGTAWSHNGYNALYVTGYIKK